MIGKKILGTILCAAIAFTALTGCAGGGTKKVGISMPTQDLQRWNQDGAYMEEKFKAAGYEVDLKYAGNKADVQLSQVEDMINTGCKVIIIAAVVVLYPLLAALLSWIMCLILHL